MLPFVNTSFFLLSIVQMVVFVEEIHQFIYQCIRGNFNNENMYKRFKQLDSFSNYPSFFVVHDKQNKIGK